MHFTSSPSRHAALILPRAAARSLAVVALGATAAAPLGAQSRRDWMFGPFEKPRAANPVLVPRATSTFRSPLSDSTVRWEEHATFNPAAVVRGERVVMLYRAEDDPGTREIGHHTSRLGMAESTDGLGFTRHDTPVLYPDRDAQAKYEW